MASMQIVGVYRLRTRGVSLCFSCDTEQLIYGRVAFVNVDGKHGFTANMCSSCLLPVEKITKFADVQTATIEA